MRRDIRSHNLTCKVLAAAFRCVKRARVRGNVKEREREEEEGKRKRGGAVILVTLKHPSFVRPLARYLSLRKENEALQTTLYLSVPASPSSKPYPSFSSLMMSGWCKMVLCMDVASVSCDIP